MKMLNNWEKDKIVHRDKILSFEFLAGNGYISEISDGFYYMSEDPETVETELWRKLNSELANELNIQDIDREIRGFIGLLNSYNEIKDIGQELIGRIAVLGQTTTKDVHEELGMSME